MKKKIENGVKAMMTKADITQNQKKGGKDREARDKWEKNKNSFKKQKKRENKMAVVTMNVKKKLKKRKKEK